MTKIIFKGLKTETRGKGKKKRLSIVGFFHDYARPEKPRIYNLRAVDNAIADRKRQKKETKGLEYGREKILKEYKDRGIAPPQ